MATKNNPVAGYANGTLGTVTGFERGTGYPQVETYEGRTLVMAPAEWAVEEGGKVKAKVTQIPLRLAWAITIHKSQGMSMDAAAMDLSRAFEYGQGYVALSRLRTLSGLSLTGWSEQALLVHPSVAEKDGEFRMLSEAARTHFEALSVSGERKEMEERFLRALGGSLEEIKQKEKSKESTFDQTLAHLEEGLSLAQIAKARTLSISTICDHVARLAKEGRLDADTLTHFLPGRVQGALKPIFAAFDTEGTSKLAPVRTHLKNKYTFDELTLARALYLLQT